MVNYELIVIAEGDKFHAQFKGQYGLSFCGQPRDTRAEAEEDLRGMQDTMARMQQMTSAQRQERLQELMQGVLKGME